MAAEFHPLRQLFGGAISTLFPSRFQDVSNIRQVPDNQEVFVDPSRDESLVFELLEFKPEVADELSASWFLRDLAEEQDAELDPIIEQSGVVAAPQSACRTAPAVLSTAVGQMVVSKGRQGPEAQNLVKVYLANLRLREVNTDVLIVAYEPIVINPLSENAASVGAGLVVPAAQSGCTPMAEVFQLAVSSFKISDWNLFGLQQSFLDLSHSTALRLRLHLHKSFLDLSQLRELSLSQVNLRDFQQLPSGLSILRLQHCEQSGESPDLSNLSILSKLEVLDSKMAMIHGLEHLQALNTLIIRSCKIDRISGLERLTNLRVLSLSDSDFLERLPDITLLKRLEKKEIEFCKFVEDQHNAACQ